MDSVHVCIRVRPMSLDEKANQTASCIKIPKSESQTQILVGKDRQFTFDQVFDPKRGQEDVYRMAVTKLVKTFAEGYNATVLAYGQTGTGKTHTVLGSSDEYNNLKESHGIIPRVIFELYQLLEEKNVSFENTSIHVEYIEVYNETIRDLLHPEISSKQINIRENKNGNMTVTGITSEKIHNIREIFRCLAMGTACRSTAGTASNEFSSRSHAIFTLVLRQRGRNNQHLQSKFHLVDLAGSERVKKSKVSGNRLKEAVNINQGLLALGNVISALSESTKRGHIPYRQSKITRILQDSLGGNSKTLMIACISPSIMSFEETVNTLKYANRAKNIRNKAIVNQYPEESTNNNAVVQMQNEIDLLKMKLQSSKHPNPVEIPGENLNVISDDAMEVSKLKDALLAKTTKLDTVMDIIDDIKRVAVLALDKNEYAAGDNTLACEIRNIFLDTISDLHLIKDSCCVNNTTIVKRRRSMAEGTAVVSKELSSLREQLTEAQDDLAKDEEIFASKNSEIIKLQNLLIDAKAKNEVLLQRLEEMDLASPPPLPTPQGKGAKYPLQIYDNAFSSSTSFSDDNDDEVLIHSTQKERIVEQNNASNVSHFIDGHTRNVEISNNEELRMALLSVLNASDGWVNLRLVQYRADAILAQKHQLEQQQLELQSEKSRLEIIKLRESISVNEMEHIEAQLAGGGKELEQIESEISSLHEKQSLMCDEVELLEAEIKQKYIKCDKDVVSAVQDIILSSYQQLTFSDLTYVIAQVTEYLVSERYKAHILKQNVSTLNSKACEQNSDIQSLKVSLAALHTEFKRRLRTQVDDETPNQSPLKSPAAQNSMESRDLENNNSTTPLKHKGSAPKFRSDASCHLQRMTNEIAFYKSKSNLLQDQLSKVNSLSSDDNGSSQIEYLAKINDKLLKELVNLKSYYTSSKSEKPKPVRIDKSRLREIELPPQSPL